MVENDCLEVYLWFRCTVALSLCISNYVIESNVPLAGVLSETVRIREIRKRLATLVSFPLHFLKHPGHTPPVIEDEGGVSKGYGFVRFTDERERDAAIARLDGTTGLGKKPIAVKLALAPRQR